MAVVPSYFGTLAEGQNLQALVDNSLEALNAQSIWRKYLSVGVPSASLTFEAVVGASRIEAAASIVDPDSKKPIRSRSKLNVYTGNIPSIQQKIPMNQADFRAMMMLESTMTDAAARKDQLIKLLFNDVQKCATAADKRVDIMLLQALSTGSVDVTTTNNPDGVVYGSVSLLMADNQIQGVPVVWSNIASTPLTDMDAFVAINKQRGRTFGRILMPFEVWVNFKKTTEVKSALSTFYTGKTNQTVALTLGNINDYMIQNMLPAIEVVDYTAGIETDGIVSTYRPFDANNVSFVPSGELGVLKNAIAVEERIKAPQVNYAMYGRTLVSKWMENDPAREWTGCELNAFPAIDIDSVFILETDSVQASFI